MKILQSKLELSQHLDHLKSLGYAVGFVPTMGALHRGHLSLVNRALSQNEVVVVSIFVNPIQFDNKEDLMNYPRNLESDIALLETLNDARIILYAPATVDIYGDKIVSESFDYDGLEHEMEGAFRDGHFDGVGTIVKRLLELVKPDEAYFGEKDFQQLQIIKKLVAKNNIPVKIVGVDIYRAEDGLAMSSRNVRLSPEHRAAAPFIYKTLRTAKTKFGTESALTVLEWVEAQFKTQPLLKLEYFIIADSKTLKPIRQKSIKKSYRAFIAVYAGDIRLIDNIALN